MDEEVRSIFGMTDATETPTETPTPPPSAAVTDALRTEEGLRTAGVPTTTPLRSLASYVMSRFKENEDFRRQSGVTERLDYCARANRGEFSKVQEAVLSTKFPPELIRRMFVPITATKIRAARAMLVDLANQSGDPLFRIVPSPSPEVPEQVTADALKSVTSDVATLFANLERQGVTELPPEALNKLLVLVKTVTESTCDTVKDAEENYARVRADRMQKKVWDTLLEGGFKDAFMAYIDDICTYGTGVIVGPVVRNVHRNVCRTDTRTGAVKYRRVTQAIPTYEAVSPFDCYPAPDAKDVCDGAFCMTVKYTADELARYAEEAKDGDDGWIRATVRSLVAKHPRGGVKLNIASFDADRRICENNGFSDTNDCTFEGVRCFATVRGSELLEMGVTKTPTGRSVAADSFYKTETVVVDNVVAYCRIYPNEMDVPVSRGVFYTLPGSWWGASIAEKVAMCQTVLNNCIKALLQNMPLASGPIIWVNEAQRLINRSATGMRFQAGDVVAFGSSMSGMAGAPMGALQIPSNANELLGVFTRMQTQADLDSGLPAYTEGQSAGQSGALRTASGLAMYTEASNRGMKMVMTTTDHMVINRLARMTADWILLNDDNMDLKGDVNVQSVGLVGKVLKAQRDQARMQLMQLVMNSPLLQNVVGVKGVVAMFRPSLVDLDLNPNDILPSKVRMEAMEQIEGIKQVFEATRATNGAVANSAEVAAMAQANGQAAGAPQGQPPAVEMPRGGVAERRGMA